MSYNLSGGLFFNQHNMYFADFSYFAKRYFPEPWGDRFGGIFQHRRRAGGGVKSGSSSVQDLLYHGICSSGCLTANFAAKFSLDFQ